MYLKTPTGWKVAVSGLIALPGLVAVALWVVSFRDPALTSRDDLLTLYLTVFFSSLAAPLVAAVWRWRAGSSWHANAALAIDLVAQGFNCVGFLGAVGAGAVG